MTIREYETEHLKDQAKKLAVDYLKYQIINKKLELESMYFDLEHISELAELKQCSLLKKIAQHLSEMFQINTYEKTVQDIIGLSWFVGEENENETE